MREVRVFCDRCFKECEQDEMNYVYGSAQIEEEDFDKELCRSC